MQWKMWIFLGSMSIIAGMAGCETAGGAAPIQNTRSLNPGLVMPTPLMMEMALVKGSQGAGWGDPQLKWELGRNDSPVRATRGLPDYPDYLEIQYSQRERLQVTNGRPWENSSYSTRIHDHRLRR